MRLDKKTSLFIGISVLLVTLILIRQGFTDEKSLPPLAEATSFEDIEKYLFKTTCDEKDFSEIIHRITSDDRYRELRDAAERRVAEHISRRLVENNLGKLFHCLSIAGERVSPAYIKPRSDSKSILSRAYEYRDEVKKLSRGYSQIEVVKIENDQADEIIKYHKAAMHGAVQLDAYMVGEHEPKLYEISLWGGKRALLRTKETSFSSKGRFLMVAKEVDKIDVKLKENAGGFTAKWTVYEEIPEYFKIKKLLQEAEQLQKQRDRELRKTLAILRESGQSLRVEFESLLPHYKKVGQ